MKAALKFEDVSLSFGPDVILKGVDLNLEPGKITALVGRSGSGKSLTALSAIKLTPEDADASGAILLGDQNISTSSEQDMCSIRGRRISMIFQEPMTALNPLQTIGVQVAEVLTVHQMTDHKAAVIAAESLLYRVGLNPDTISPRRYPHELSGGQRQRVMIAIAIAAKPDVIVADEPTTALDVTTQAEILTLLRALVTEENIALLFITHDLAIVSEIADEITEIEDGFINRSYSKSDFFEKQYEQRKASGFVQNSTPRKLRVDDQRGVFVDVQNLTCEYQSVTESRAGRTDTFRAVDNVTFCLRRGENLGLIGESGCGKSTLARALLGLQPISSGQITVDGIPFPSDNMAALRKTRKKIQIVFQDPYSSFNPRHTVDQIIGEPFHLFDERPEKKARQEMIAERLEAVGLHASDMRKYPHQFSGGQRQRIAIARALITDPEVIVLDEATSALDVHSRSRVLNLLMQLSDERGVSYLIITHDITVIRDVADRILVMKSGSIVEEGPTSQVLKEPQHDYTKALISAAPTIDWNKYASSQTGQSL